MLTGLRERYDRLSKKYYLPGFGIALILLSGVVFVAGYALLRTFSEDRRPTPAPVHVTTEQGTAR